MLMPRTLRKAILPAPAIRVPKKRGPKPKGHKTRDALPPGKLVIKTYSPRDMFERFSLPSTDSNYRSPKTLSPDTRCKLVYWAMYMGDMTRYEICSLLEISADTLAKDLQRISKEAFNYTEEVSVENIANSMLRHGESLATRAAKNGDIKDAWQIRRELIELMQSLGVTFKKPDEHRIIEQWDIPGLLTDKVEEEEETAISKTEGNGHGNGNGNGEH